MTITIITRERAYRVNGSFDVWQRNLADWAADYLVLASPLVAEYKWASEHPEAFNLTFEAGSVWVYRIVEPPLGAENPAQ